MADLDDLSAGDHVLFGDRQQPLTVTAVEEHRVFVEGPQGGEYMLFETEDDPDTLLVAKPGNREYASYAEDLEIVGTWEDVDDLVWRHTDTGAEIRVEENDMGYWEVHTDLDHNRDLPGYGFAEREDAVQEAERLRKRHPRG